MAKKKKDKSKGVVDADGKRWYNSIDPGIDTSWGSAIYNGPGILFRLVTGVKRDEFSPEYEENLWKAYTMGGTDGLPKSNVRFDGEDLGDADVVGLPQEQAVIVQSIADTIYAKQIRDKVRNKMYSSPGEDEAMRRKAIEYQDVAEKILNSPGEWVSIREGSSPVREFKKVGKREVGFTGLGGLKNFDVRWNPKESTLDVRDEYDFKDEGVEGNIPRRDRRLFIRDRIKFYPEKGGVFYRNPKKVEEMGYRSRFEEGGIVGLKPEDGISLYYVPVMDEGGEVEKPSSDYYASRDNTSVGGTGIDANANYGQRVSPQFNIGEAIAGFTPVVGDAVDVKDLIESYSNRDWLGMGLAAAGFIPIGGDLLQEYIRLKKAKFLEEIPVRSEKRTSGMGLRDDIKESDEELIKSMPSYAKPNSPMSGASVAHISRLDNGAYERITGRLRDDFIRNARDLEQLYPGIYKRVFNVDKSDIDDEDLTNLLEMFYFKKKGEFSNIPKEDKMDMLDKIRSKIFEDSPMYKIGNDGDNAIVYSEDAYTRLFPDDKNKEGINVGISHELDHAVQSNASKEFLKELSDSSNEWFDDSRLNDEWKGVFENRIELAARGSQIKDYFGLTDDSQKITSDMLKYAARHYTEDNWINNNMSEFFHGIKDWDKAADWITKYSTVTIPAAAIPYFVEEGERAQMDDDEFNKKYKVGGKLGGSISDTGFSYYYGYKPFYNIKNFNTRRNYVRNKLIDEYGMYEWDADDALNDIIPKSMLDDGYYDVKNNTYGIGQWGGDDLKRFKAMYDKGGLDDQIDFLAKEYKKKNGGFINNMDDLYIYLRSMHVKKEGGLVEKQDELYSTLTEEYGMKPIQAIAVIANLTHESNLDETILGDSGASLGLQQWKGERRDALESFAFAKGHPVPTFDDQIEFLMNEYNSGQAFQFDYKGQNLYVTGKTKNPTFDYYQYSKSDFDKAENLYDAVIAWNQGVGRPSKKYAYNDRRYNISKKIADRHGIKYSNKSYFGEMGMNPEWVDVDAVFTPAVSSSGVSGSSRTPVDGGSRVDAVSAGDSTGGSGQVPPQGTGEPVLSGEEMFMQQYGNAIVQQMLAADMKYTGINDQSSELAKRQKEIASDARRVGESIRESEQQRREREFLASILPSIQLNVKGVSRN